MTKLLSIFLSVVSISCVSIAGNRTTASVNNSDFPPEYRAQLEGANKKESFNNEEYQKHLEFVRNSERGGRL